jgi:hypothetical protein
MREWVFARKRSLAVFLFGTLWFCVGALLMALGVVDALRMLEGNNGVPFLQQE